MAGVERTTGQMLTWVAAAVLGTLALMRLVDAGGDRAPAPTAPPVAVSAGGRAERPEAAGAYVHVAGAVRRPGLYKLPASARVAVALERAGGPRGKANLAAVNLAARVEDGQQIVVPLVGAAASAAGTPGTAAAGGAGSAAGASAGAKLSLAAATIEQLEELDGIGPTLAKRIVEYRDSKGGFRSVGQLREVDGIGEKRFAALRDAVTP